MKQLDHVTFVESSKKEVIRILLVEDNPGDVIIFKEILKYSGTPFSLTNVSTLEKAMFMLEQNCYDVILLDLGLPDSSGLETLQKIQLMKVVPPVVVMTGLDDEVMALEALRSGAQDYLVKSKLSSENILRSVKYSIERKKLQNLKEKNAMQFSIISAATSALNDCEDISLIYKIVCDNIKKLISKTNIITIEYKKDTNYIITNIDWLEPFYKEVTLLSGMNLKELNFSSEKINEELLNLLNDGKLHEVSGGLNRIFGNRLDEISGKKLEKTLKINNINVIGFAKNKHFYGGALIFTEEKIGTDDGKIIETIGSEASLSINRRLIYINLRLSELRIRKLNAELELKVKQRTEDLLSANIRLTDELKERKLAQEALRESEKKLIDLNITKDKFFNIVAHDLKNPFTSLLGSTELLYENIEQMDTESIKKLAQILNDSAKSGYAILLNLLDWSRSQTGLIKFNPELINIKSIIDENIADLQLYTTNKSIKIESDITKDLFIFADENMINTVLRNLLSNAVKFTHRNGKVNISAEINDTNTVISIRDTGVGLSEEDLRKLFRLDTKYTSQGTDKEQGTGLGLKLCKEFVEKQGGKIWVESTINKGSRFSFSVPRQ